MFALILTTLLHGTLGHATPQATVPMTSLDFWNDPAHQEENNCYNYGTNRMTDSFAQPGEASGKSLNELKCDVVYAAASSDLGLVPTTFFPYNSKSDDTLIALVVAPNYDFHWYRRDDSGKWTHKMGPTPAATVDNDGKEITDVEKANRGNYIDFCGYFRIKNYTSRPDEQNGGYVRVGNMTDLPKMNQSEVVILQYSGRRNPTIPLKDYLANPEVAAQLQGLKDQVGVAAFANDSEIGASMKLGYHGIEIRDNEGLMFPKGSRVHIRGAMALAYFANSAHPISITLPLSSTLEQNLLNMMGPARK